MQLDCWVVQILLVANKTDLSHRNHFDQAALGAKWNARVIETSAKNSENFETVFNQVASKYIAFRWLVGGALMRQYDSLPETREDGAW